MTEPIFWLGVSLLLVAVSLTAVLVAAVPAFRELARAARSAEKLFDTLSRELPPTLESIRLTGVELTDLTEDVSEGVQSAGRVVKHVDQSIVGVAQQAKRAQTTTRSIWTGVKAAWKAFNKSPQRPMPERFSSKIRRSSALDAPHRGEESWQSLEQLRHPTNGQERQAPATTDPFITAPADPHYPQTSVPLELTTAQPLHNDEANAFSDEPSDLRS